ncbi:hypothetical protein [Rhizobium sp. 21-4511-3d]
MSTQVPNVISSRLTGDVEDRVVICRPANLPTGVAMNGTTVAELEKIAETVERLATPR